MITAGFGFRQGAPAASLRAALDVALAATGAEAPWMLAAPMDKTEDAGFMAFAAALGLPVAPVSAEMLQAQEVTTLSHASLCARGTGSVAEAAALAAAGPGARLLGPRSVSPDGAATCAIAQGAMP